MLEPGRKVPLGPGSPHSMGLGGVRQEADRHLQSAGACTDPSWPGLQEALNPVIVGIKLSVFCSSACI